MPSMSVASSFERGGAQLLLAGMEAEWLATSHLGLRVEPEIARTAQPGGDRHDGLVETDP